MSRRRVLILGGGVTGLTAAWRAAEAGLAPVVFEASARTGGMGGSMNTAGFVLDHGIHGLYSARGETKPLVEEIHRRFGADFHVCSKRTSIHFRDRYLKYPMGIREMLRALPISTSAACILDFVRTRAHGRLRDIGVADSFQDWVTDRFGKRLYDIYFGPYVEKVWGISGTQMSSAWLARRISQISIVTEIRRALRAVFTRRPPDEMHSLQPQTFLYPRKGSGELIERIEAAAIAGGAKLHHRHKVVGVRRDPDGIFSVTVLGPEGERVERGEGIISSLPIPLLIQLLGDIVPAEVTAASSTLRYRSMVIVNLFVDRPKVYDDQWVYYSRPDLPFNRINEFTNLGEGFSPSGRTALNCEITCFRDDATWTQSDQQLRDRCVSSLESLGILRGAEVFDHSVARLPNAYPIFDVGCERRLGVVMDFVRSVPGLHTAGRQGRFEYINMDECIWHATEDVQALTDRPVRAAPSP